MGKFCCPTPTVNEKASFHADDDANQREIRAIPGPSNLGPHNRGSGLDATANRFCSTRLALDPSLHSEPGICRVRQAWGLVKGGELWLKT